MANQKQSLQIHIKKYHENEEIYSCQKCLLIFQKKYHLEAHQVLHKIHKEFQSKPLSYDNSSKYILKTKNKNTIYECTQCGKDYPSELALTRHYKRVHSDPRYACSICFKEFTGYDRLESHFRTHTGEKPFKCYYCPHKYADKGNLNKHMKIHNIKKKKKKVNI